METLRGASLLSGIAVVLALVSASDRSLAAASAVDPWELPAKTRADLRAEIDKARIATPELFKVVADIAARAGELDAGARMPGTPLTMHFKPLGNRALYALLDVLVFDTHARRNLSASAASALRIGLLEAVGAIRDDRAIPVLANVLDTSRDPTTVRAAAEGLARIGTDEAVTLLLAAATKAKAADPGKAREVAILSAMHDCRRESAARFLGARLAESPDSETARTAVKALGGVGNAWAWRTLAVKTEEGATRRLAASVLVDAYVRFKGDVREAAAKALLVVDDPSTPSLVAKARASAGPELLPILDLLEKRLATNPTR